MARSLRSSSKRFGARKELASRWCFGRFRTAQVLGYPALLMPWVDYETTWRLLQDGEADLWPEVWLTEEGADFCVLPVTPRVNSSLIPDCGCRRRLLRAVRSARTDCAGRRHASSGARLEVLNSCCRLSLSFFWWVRFSWRERKAMPYTHTSQPRRRPARPPARFLRWLCPNG